MDLIQVISLLFIGFIVFTIDKKKENLPVPMVLVLTGILLSFSPFFSTIEPSKELIHDWFLPAVLFTAAYQFNSNWLKENAWLIAFISTMGLMASVLILGASIHFIGLAALPFTAALLISSILSPIDSASVIPIQQETEKDQQAEKVVEGESMASDGTSIVLFTAASTLFFAQEQFQFFSFAGTFFLKTGGGILIGLLLGWLFSKVLHLLSHHHYQVMLSIILAYASFYIAEHFHLAGLLATIVAGLTLSRKLDRSTRKDEYRSYLDGFWEVLEPAILSLIFLSIGIEFLDHIDWSDFLSIVIIFLLTLLIRLCMLTLTIKSIPTWRKRFNWKELILITLSGIKGTVSVALLLGLTASQNSHIDSILSLAFGVVILSIVLQSICIYPLSKYAARREN